MLCNVLIRIHDIQEFTEVHLHELAVSTTEWIGQREASERELSEGERDWRKTEGDVRESEREIAIEGERRGGNSIPHCLFMKGYWADFLKTGFCDALLL
jgi:hypothetical protein